MKKRLISTLLALCMVLALVPGTAGAESLANDLENLAEISESTRTSSSQAEVPYEVDGGNIYFNKTSGAISRSDYQVAKVIIPEEIDGIAVTKISTDAFENRKSLTIVTIPIEASKFTISSYAFSFCNGLTGLVVPSCVTKIDGPIFYSCENLEKIIVDQNNPAYSSQYGILFDKAYTKLIQYPSGKSEKSYEIPSKVTKIGGGAFNFCRNLESIVIPNDVTVIGGGAFSHCSSLKSITIPTSVKSLAWQVFEDCTSLSSVTIPKSVTKIDEYAFHGCDNLTDVYYGGTQEEWNAITIGIKNEPLTSAKIHYGTSIPSPNLDAPVISLTTSANIKEGTGSGVRWDAVDTAEIYYITVHNRTSGEYIYREQAFGGTSFLLPANKLPAGTYNIWIYAKKTYNGFKVQSAPSNILTLTVGQGSSEPDTPSKPTPPADSMNLEKYFSTSKREPIFVNGICSDKAWALTASTRYGYKLKDELSLTDSEKEGFVRAITASSTGNGQSNIEQRNQRLANLIFEATYRPKSFGGTEDKVKNWPWQNCNCRSKGIECTHKGTAIEDVGLGKTVKINKSQGCCSYARFVCSYIYDGKQGTGIDCADLSAAGIQQFFQTYLDPGESIYYHYKKLNADGSINKKIGQHWLAFLGEYSSKDFQTDAPGFYYLGYGGGAGNHEIYIGRISYEDFAKLVTELTIYDTDMRTSGLRAGKESIKLDCPVEMVFTINGLTLDSRGVEGTISNNLSTMTATGSGADRTVLVEAAYNSDTDSHIEIFGTDTGKMSLVVTFEGEDGTQDVRTFKDVPVTSTTTAYTTRFASYDTLELHIIEPDSLEIWLANNGDIVTGPDSNYNPFSTDGDVSGEDISLDFDDFANYSSYIHTPAVTGGTVVLTKHTAAPGDWVNVYTTPDDGYRLDSLTVTDQRGWPVIVREMGENAFSFTMPAARVTVTPVFVKVEENDAYSTTIPGTIPNIEGSSPGYGSVIINPAAMNYSDVNAGDWFYEDVRFCHQRYLMNNTGEAEGKFEPNAPAVRAVLWAALSRMAGRNTITRGDNWYDRAMIWAKNKGITDGENPLDTITREQLVTMLWRYRGNKYVHVDHLSRFTDSDSVSWWAAEAVNWAVAEGIINGSNGSLDPQGNATRAEVAAILSRFCQFAG